MKLHFYGAARTVTGSQFLLEVNGKRLLVDCGMYQGKRAESYARNRSFAYDPQSVDAVLLTHAHIDHSGNLPNLVKNGYRGPVYTTSATCDLAGLMLRDSGHIQEADAEFVNKKRAERGEPPVEPLYTLEDAEKAAELLTPMEYGQAFEPVDGVTVRLVDAGHVLGSASAWMEVEEHVGGGRASAGGLQKKRLWFSGDIGRRNMPILRDPVLPKDVDYLVMESTYGDKIHADPQEAIEEFYQVTMQTIHKRGKVIVPAFAVGRTQELVYALNQFVTDNRMPEIPVYVDSPLAVNASDIFRRHLECYDEETREFIAEHHHPALEFPRLTYIRTVEESKRLNNMEGPMIIISASGMAETGRILHHLKNNIEDPKNMILIVSWQAPDTLGRRLADRAQKVRIFGEEYVRRAGVATIGGLSGHAGQDLLVEYANASRGSLKHVFLVHGEPKSAEALQERLKQTGLRQFSYPQQNEMVEI
jgi:metallo-beta-lactamase family protein